MDPDTFRLHPEKSAAGVPPCRRKSGRRSVETGREKLNRRWGASKTERGVNVIWTTSVASASIDEFRTPPYNYATFETTAQEPTWRYGNGSTFR